MSSREDDYSLQEIYLLILLTNVTCFIKKLILGSNANNSGKASLSNFNANNSVSNANTNISCRTKPKILFLRFIYNLIF